jgi:hypothetical protein
MYRDFSVTVTIVFSSVLLSGIASAPCVSRETQFDGDRQISTRCTQEIAHCAQNPIFVWIILWKLSPRSNQSRPYVCKPLSPNKIEANHQIWPMS